MLSKVPLVLSSPLATSGTARVQGLNFLTMRTKGVRIIVGDVYYTSPQDFTLAISTRGVGTITWLNAATIPAGSYALQIPLDTDTNLGAMDTIGTRRYGEPMARVTVVTANAQSAAIAAGVFEVLLHASTRCFVKGRGTNPTATTSDIPLEAGEKFHMRVLPGDKIAVIRDTADGYLNIIPVE